MFDQQVALLGLLLGQRTPLGLLQHLALETAEWAAGLVVDLVPLAATVAGLVAGEQVLGLLLEVSITRTKSYSTPSDNLNSVDGRPMDFLVGHIWLPSIDMVRLDRGLMVQ